MAPKKTTKKRKTEKAPAVDKLLVPAIGIAAALMGYQFFTGLSSAANIERIDPNDDVMLREVFFGEVSGKNSYAVLCSKEEETHVSSVFSDASGGGSPALFRLLDCNYVLPESEKSIADRFGLNMKKRPTIFLSGAVGEPKQVGLLLSFFFLSVNLSSCFSITNRYRTYSYLSNFTIISESSPQHQHQNNLNI